MKRSGAGSESLAPLATGFVCDDHMRAMTPDSFANVAHEGSCCIGVSTGRKPEIDGI
ncbi:MAG: hypothetical protein ABJP66_01790 [Hyphomicrobiales bacterium]